MRERYFGWTLTLNLPRIIVVMGSGCERSLGAKSADP